MAQVKIYGFKDQLAPRREALSRVIHACVVEALAFPPDKRAHRFFLMEPHAWGFRGQHGDESALSYEVDI